MSCYDAFAAALDSQYSLDELEGVMPPEATKQTFLASVWQEDGWHVAQAMGVDIASQGKTVDTALANLREALELHFESPVATATPQVHHIEAAVSSSQ